MITTNVYTRVFHIRYGQGTGTCFASDFEGRQYLVTAKHVIAGLTNNSNIELYHNGSWVTLQARLVGHHASADVSVISINQSLANLKLEASSNGIMLGQDTFFLGFPYMLADEANTQINRNFPLPLVKKAALSAILNDGLGHYMLLDGLNNPGFSGGPVVFAQPNQNTYKIAAIISGYRFSEEPVYQAEEQVPLNVRTNTGIIIAYNIENAIELIRANPIGFEL